MNRPLSQETQSQIRMLSDLIAQRDQLGDDVQEELRGHIEDKVIAYLDGKIALTEDDALLLAREHFGRTQDLVVARNHNRENSTAVTRGKRMASKPAEKQIAIAALVASMLVFSCITLDKIGGDPDVLGGMIFNIQWGRLEISRIYEIGSPIPFGEWMARPDNKYTSLWRPWRIEFDSSMNIGQVFHQDRPPTLTLSKDLPDFVRPSKQWVVRIPAALIPLTFFLAGWGCQKLVRSRKQRQRNSHVFRTSSLRKAADHSEIAYG
jgi:hypothetical protein